MMVMDKQVRLMREFTAGGNVDEIERGGNRHALPRPRTAKAVSPPIYTLPFFPSSDVLIHANELSIECPEFRIPLSFSELADNERINSKKKSKVVLIQQKIIKSKPQIRDL